MSQVYYDLDLIEDINGHIFSVVGNQKQSPIHCRLTYVSTPDGRNDKIKTTLINPTSIHYKKLINLPGEQHYLVPQKDISRHYTSKDVIENPISIISKINDIVKGDLPEIHLGYTGSLQLGTDRPNSDLDLVIHCHQEQVSKIHDLLKSEGYFENLYIPQQDFIWKKYKTYKMMSKDSLIYSFTKRWKYFLVDKRQISLFFVAPEITNYSFERILNTREYLTIEGTVQHAYGSFFTPKLFLVTTAQRTYTIISWLFLLNGMFSDGDRVRINGELVYIANEQFVLLHPQSTIEFLET